MSDLPDPYVILGVAHDASQAQINAAYRAALVRHHPATRPRPDMVVSDDAAEDRELQRVLAAYAVLGEPRHRAVYDRAHPPTSGQPVPVRVRHIPPEQPPIVAGPVRWWPRR